MSIIKKRVYKDRKYLCFGPVRIPYETDRTAEIRKLKIGPFVMNYRYCEEYGDVFLLLFGREIPVRTSDETSRHMRHYRMRHELTDEKRREMLTQELAPLLDYTPDLVHPVTFNEKINWLKLHHHDPLITTCCDKYAVKEYAAGVIGEEYVLPVLGVWDRAEDIDFDALPERFALKVNWSSGYNIIVSDRARLDEKTARRQVKTWMQPQNNSYYSNFNWGYKNMKPVVYAEPYIEQIDGQVYDYKFFMCEGKLKFMFIATDRSNGKGLTHDFFDPEFQWLPFTYRKLRHADQRPPKPKHYDDMIRLAEQLAKPFPFVRVDFYEVDDKIYLGEMTFYPGGGTLPMNPPEWDRILGEQIDLSAVETDKPDR